MTRPMHGQPLTPGPTLTIEEAPKIAYPCPTCGAGLFYLHVQGYHGYHCKTCEPHLNWGQTKVSESNGNGSTKVRIGRRGIVTFQLDDGFPEIKVDVVAAWNEWGRIDRAFRDDNGSVPDDRMEEHQASAMRFACAYMQDQSLSGAEAWGFIARLTEEVDKLKDFLSIRTLAKPESPDSSTTLTTCD